MKWISVLAILCLGCAGHKHLTPAPRKAEQVIVSDHQVSVRTGGSLIDNFQAPLVHRICVAEVRRDLPFVLQPERDHVGQVAGIRVTKIRPVARPEERLGLEEQDIVTAVGRRRVTQPADLTRVVDELAHQRESSLSIHRRGTPHKILLYRERCA